MDNVTDFEDILIHKYGKKGTEKRAKYDTESLAFRLGVMLKEARKDANLTQEELAERTGTHCGTHMSMYMCMVRRRGSTTAGHNPATT